MASDSRLLIVEQVLENPPAMVPALMNVGMLNVGGKERTLEDFHALLEGTGLKMSQTYTDKMSQDVILECVKI